MPVDDEQPASGFMWTLDRPFGAVRTGTRCRAADGAWNMSPFLYGVGQCGPRDAISRGVSRLVLPGGLAALCELVIHPVVSFGGRSGHGGHSGHGGRPRLRDCAIVNARDAACVAESQNPCARRVPRWREWFGASRTGGGFQPHNLGRGMRGLFNPFRVWVVAVRMIPGPRPGLGPRSGISGVPFSSVF